MLSRLLWLLYLLASATSRPQDVGRQQSGRGEVNNPHDTLRWVWVQASSLSLAWPSKFALSINGAVTAYRLSISHPAHAHAHAPVADTTLYHPRTLTHQFEGLESDITYSGQLIALVGRHHWPYTLLNFTITSPALHTGLGLGERVGGVARETSSVGDLDDITIAVRLRWSQKPFVTASVPEEGNILEDHANTSNRRMPVGYRLRAWDHKHLVAQVATSANDKDKGCEATLGGLQVDIVYKVSLEAVLPGDQTGPAISFSLDAGALNVAGGGLTTDGVTECYSGLQVRCPGAERCVSPYWICDSAPDCPDGADEVGCEDTPCAGFRCFDDACIAGAWRCDGHRDCKDGDDEYACPECTLEEVSCPQGGGCIPKNATCDGVPNCPDGWDESASMCGPNFCSPKELQCVEGGRCISHHRLCDLVPDCPNAEDEDIAFCSSFNHISKDAVGEQGVVTLNPKVTSEGEMIDPNSKETGREEYIYINNKDQTEEEVAHPNPKLGAENDVPYPHPKTTSEYQPIHLNPIPIDTSEEDSGYKDTAKETTTSTPCKLKVIECTDLQYQCESGQCIHKSYLCNGIKDCEDGEDEQPHNCKKVSTQIPKSQKPPYFTEDNKDKTEEDYFEESYFANPISVIDDKLCGEGECTDDYNDDESLDINSNEHIIKDTTSSATYDDDESNYEAEDEVDEDMNVNNSKEKNEEETNMNTLDKTDIILDGADVSVEIVVEDPTYSHYDEEDLSHTNNENTRNNSQSFNLHNKAHSTNTNVDNADNRPSTPTTKVIHEDTDYITFIDESDEPNEDGGSRTSPSNDSQGTVTEMNTSDEYEYESWEENISSVVSEIFSTLKNSTVTSELPISTTLLPNSDNSDANNKNHSDPTVTIHLPESFDSDEELHTNSDSETVENVKSLNVTGKLLTSTTSESITSSPHILVEEDGETESFSDLPEISIMKPSHQSTTTPGPHQSSTVSSSKGYFEGDHIMPTTSFKPTISTTEIVTHTTETTSQAADTTSQTTGIPSGPIETTSQILKRTSTTPALTTQPENWKEESEGQKNRTVLIAIHSEMAPMNESKVPQYIIHGMDGSTYQYEVVSVMDDQEKAEKDREGRYMTRGDGTHEYLQGNISSASRFSLSFILIGCTLCFLSLKNAGIQWIDIL